MANIIPSVLGIVGAISGINQQKSANSQAKSDSKQAKKITDAQLKYFLEQIMPYGEAGGAAGKGLASKVGTVGSKALDIGTAYDPERDTAAQIAAYDKSRSADFNAARLPIALRGLKDSSADSSAYTGVASRRAFDISQIKANEPGKALGVLGQSAGIGNPAFQTLNPAAIAQGTVGSLPGAAQTLSNMAQFNYGQAASINPFKSLQGINWDWLKMK